ncbi:MAG: hypothetical protein ABSE62_00185 [Chthoniobacteraceae bacterium]|jgi:hypothetical protein
MKRNLILPILACGASLLLATVAQAQSPALVSGSSSATPGEGGGHRHGGVLAHLTYALGLSGSQQAEIAPIIEAAKPQLKQIHDNAQTQRDQVLNNVGAQITPLLTPDQQTKFAAMLQRFENGGGAGRHFGRHFKGAGAGGAGGQGDMLARLTTQLGLTTDEQGQIKPILDAAHTQIESIRQNTSLTPEQKFAQIKTVMDAAHGQINGILTPAQQEQLASLKGQFHHHNHHGWPSPSPTTSGS